MVNWCGVLMPRCQAEFGNPILARIFQTFITPEAKSQKLTMDVTSIFNNLLDNTFREVHQTCTCTIFQNYDLQQQNSFPECLTYLGCIQLQKTVVPISLRAEAFKHAKMV